MNRKDWLKIIGGLGLGATGLGLAGVGPLAGLLGSSAASGAMIPMGEMAGVGSVPAASGGLLGNAMKGIGAASKAMNVAGMMAPQHEQGMPQKPPMQQPMMTGGDFGYRGAGLPPELAGLPPNDPRVMQYMKMRGMA